MHFWEEPYILVVLLSSCPHTSSHNEGDPVPLPGPTTLLHNSASSASIGAQHSPTRRHCKTSSGMKTSSIYRALRLDESFQRVFWKSSHLAALAYKGKQACTLLQSFARHLTITKPLQCSMYCTRHVFDVMHWHLWTSEKFSSWHAWGRFSSMNPYSQLIFVLSPWFSAILR